MTGKSITRMNSTQKLYSEIVDIVIKGDIPAVLSNFESERDLLLRGTNYSFTCPKQLSRNNKPLVPCRELSLLHIAAYYDNLEMFILLHMRGISLRIPSAASYLPLHYACVGNAQEVASYILENDPEQGKLELDVQYQPINLAIFANSPEILTLLFSHGTNLQSPKIIEGRPFDQALRSRNYDCLLILLQNQCRTDVAVASMTPLMLAIVSGMTEAIGPLLSRGIDPRIVNNKGQSALACACMMEQEDVVRLLCSRMDDVEIPQIEGEPLRASIARYAIHSKNVEILRMILEKGCDVNRFDAQGELPAHSLLGITNAALAAEMLGLLIAHGFNVNVRQSQDTLRFLEYLVVKFSVQDCSKLVEFLLSHGADPRLKMNTGKTLLEHVAGFRHSASPREVKLYNTFRRFFPDELK